MDQFAFCTQGEHNRAYLLHRRIFPWGVLRESSLFADSAITNKFTAKENRNGAFGKETRSPIEGITAHSSGTRMTQLGVLFGAIEAHNSSPFDQEPRVTSSRSFQPYSLRWSYSTPVPHGRCRITAIPRRYHRNIKRMKPSQNSRRTKKLFQSSLSCERLRPLTISAIFSFLCLKSSNCYKTERQTPTDSKEPRSSPLCGPRPEIFYFGTSVSQCML